MPVRLLRRLTGTALRAVLWGVNIARGFPRKERGAASRASREHFPFETLCVSNHTAWRFAEKTRSSAWFGPGGAVSPPRVSSFSKVKRFSDARPQDGSGPCPARAFVQSQGRDIRHDGVGRCGASPVWGPHISGGLPPEESGGGYGPFHPPDKRAGEGMGGQGGRGTPPAPAAGFPFPPAGEHTASLFRNLLPAGARRATGRRAALSPFARGQGALAVRVR